MTGKKLIAALKQKLGVSTATALGKALDVSLVTLGNWRNNSSLSPRLIVDLISRLLSAQARGDEIVGELKKQFRVKHLSDLEPKLGVTGTAIHYWKNTRALTARQIAGMVEGASKTAVSHSHTTAVRPLVEFFKISKTESRQGAKFELLAIKSPKGKTNEYLAGLQAELREHHGIYVFFDSRGQAIYVGKAKKQDLWSELTSAFNRHRGSVQKIKRVLHPARSQPYRNSDENARQIRDLEVPLHELAAYFSAYEVTEALIDDLEALLVRSFANDILNKRMERFGRHRAARKKRKSRRARR